MLAWLSGHASPQSPFQDEQAEVSDPDSPAFDRESIPKHIAARLQTEKARAAALRNRWARKLQSANSEPQPGFEDGRPTLSAMMQKECFASIDSISLNQCSNRLWVQKSILSYMLAAAEKLRQSLAKFCSSQQSHVINYNVMDDCSVRLGNKSSNSSSVHTVCNNYQRVLLHSFSGQAELTCFRIHQPMMLLQNATTQVAVCSNCMKNLYFNLCDCVWTVWYCMFGDMVLYVW